MSEWISVEDKLPGINTKVEVKCKDKDGPEYQYTTALSQLEILSHITHWRPIQKPDFGKLKEGDLLSIKYKNGYGFRDKVGYFVRHEDNTGEILISMYKDLDVGIVVCEKKGIEKITRINLDDQKFEEI